MDTFYWCVWSIIHTDTKMHIVHLLIVVSISNLPGPSISDILIKLHNDLKPLQGCNYQYVKQLVAVPCNVNFPWYPSLRNS